MTLKDMKLRVLSLIEEVNPDSTLLTDDVDIQAKINYVIDTKMHELARIKKIAAVETIDVEANEDIDLYDELDNFYKLNSITGVRYEIFENIITFKEDGTARIKYFKYPKLIDEKTNNNYKFELSEDVLEIMPYGVAADLLKSDVSAQYGQVYANAYQEALNLLDLKTTGGTMEIKGGINV